VKGRIVKLHRIQMIYTMLCLIKLVKPFGRSGTLNLETSRLQSSIINTFANYFASNCSSFNDCRNEAFKLQYQELRDQYTGYPIAPTNLFDVELINKLIDKMDNGKAAGLDDVTSEHLKFSHPIVVCILTKLFNLFIINGHIP